MTERTAEQYAASTNGRVHLGETAAGDEKKPPTRSVSSMIVPIVLIATALIVLRRMQRGNYA